VVASAAPAPQGGPIGSRFAAETSGASAGDSRLDASRPRAREPRDEGAENALLTQGVDILTLT
jgi:hypothetical protein